MKKINVIKQITPFEKKCWREQYVNKKACDSERGSETYNLIQLLSPCQETMAPMHKASTPAERVDTIIK